MSLLSSSSGVLVDAACVGSEIGRNSDGASYWTILEDLLLHGFFSADRTELVHFVDIVLGRYEAIFMRMAVFALDNGRAFKTIVMSSGSVDRASLISHIVLMHVFIGRDSFTTMTPSVFGRTGEQNLRRDIDVWPLGVSSNLDSV